MSTILLAAGLLFAGISCKEGKKEPDVEVNTTEIRTEEPDHDHDVDVSASVSDENVDVDADVD